MVEVEVRAKSLSKVDEAERRIPTAVEVGRIANWESKVQLEEISDELHPNFPVDEV